MLKVHRKIQKNKNQQCKIKKDGISITDWENVKEIFL